MRPLGIFLYLYDFFITIKLDVSPIFICLSVTMQQMLVQFLFVSLLQVLLVKLHSAKYFGFRLCWKVIYVLEKMKTRVFFSESSFNRQTDRGGTDLNIFVAQDLIPFKTLYLYYKNTHSHLSQSNKFFANSVLS